MTEPDFQHCAIGRTLTYKNLAFPVCPNTPVNVRLLGPDDEEIRLCRPHLSHLIKANEFLRKDVPMFGRPE